MGNPSLERCRQLLVHSRGKKACSNWRGAAWGGFHRRDRLLSALGRKGKGLTCRSWERGGGFQGRDRRVKNPEAEKAGRVQLDQTQECRGSGGLFDLEAWLRKTSPHTGPGSTAQVSMRMIECTLPPAVLRDSGFPQLPVTVTAPRPLAGLDGWPPHWVSYISVCPRSCDTSNWCHLC